MNAVFWPPKTQRADHESDIEGRKYETFGPIFEDCDVVLVEGDSMTDATKIEVWRSETGGTPIAAADKSIAAVVTDTPTLEGVEAPLWPRKDIVSVAKRILASLPHRAGDNERASDAGGG